VIFKMASSTAWILILLAAVNSTIGNLLLKKASVPAGNFLDMVINPFFIAGLIFYGVNVLLFAKALEILPVSTAYPVLAGGGFLFLVVASNLYLGEMVGISQMLGIFLILAGVFLLAKG
jgi:undecaprenyl phosphate-alpha-L-ara4N flippase subunit ArnE